MCVCCGYLSGRVEWRALKVSCLVVLAASAGLDLNVVGWVGAGMTCEVLK